MVCRRTYSVPHFAFWPISIMGSAGPSFRPFYEALPPFSGVFLSFYVPNVRRLPRALAPRLDKQSHAEDSHLIAFTCPLSDRTQAAPW